MNLLEKGRPVVIDIDGESFQLSRMNFPIDMANLLPAIRHWAQKDGEIDQEEVMGGAFRRMQASEKLGIDYKVIRDSMGVAVGICGFRAPIPEMAQFQSSPEANAVEMIDLYLHKDYRSRRMRTELMNYGFACMKEEDYTEVLWSVGPRYQERNWDLYRIAYGYPVGEITDYSAEGLTTPVWRVILQPPVIENGATAAEDSETLTKE